MLGYVKHKQWLTEDHRATVIGNWLARNNRKAGIFFRGKISHASDKLTKDLVVDLDNEDLQQMYALLDRAQHQRPGQSPEDDVQVRMLLEECERALVAHDLAS